MTDNPLNSPIYLTFYHDDEAEFIIHEVIEDILKKAQEVIFEKHISSQVLPYAVQFCKGTMVQLIKWEFFEYDTIDEHSDIWLPDEEPASIPNDSWARGVLIPVPMSNEELQKRPRIPWNANQPQVKV